MASLPQSESVACRDAILESGVWGIGNIPPFASGDTANNKLFMERLFEHPDSLDVVAGSLGKLIMRFEPDVLWGPPQGGQDLADEMGKRLGLPVVHLEKASTRAGQKTFRIASQRDREIIENADHAVGVEDVTTKLGTLAGALRLEPLAEKTDGIAAIWRRGLPKSESRLDVPVNWIVEQHLPNIITPDHPYFLRFGHLAVQQS